MKIFILICLTILISSFVLGEAKSTSQIIYDIDYLDSRICKLLLKEFQNSKSNYFSHVLNRELIKNKNIEEAVAVIGKDYPLIKATLLIGSKGKNTELTGVSFTFNYLSDSVLYVTFCFDTPIKMLHFDKKLLPNNNKNRNSRKIIEIIKLTNEIRNYSVFERLYNKNKFRKGIIVPRP